jgi:hypothetical protein
MLHALAQTESGNSIYDISNVVKEGKIGYGIKLGAYPLIHRNVKKLSKKGLISVYEDKRGVRPKKIINLTLEGFVVYILSWNLLRFRNDSKIYDKIINYIYKSIFLHKELLPFSSHWGNIQQILGKEVLYSGLLETCNIIGAILNFYIKNPAIEFTSFIPNILKNNGIFISGDRSKSKNIQHDNEILKYIKKNKDLREILQSHLVLKDLFYSYHGYKDNVPNNNWNSEKMSAFFEDRNISDNQIFKNRRFGEFFPKYADIKYSFTGLFLDGFIWEVPKSIPDKTVGSLKDGIRITIHR